ncbi:hypothetical protein D1013_16390 [Euzebyella marina]|uniref:Uncharacterized protein n=1 Tax=Euzebyella marina TaxID=1761453 RepID=A0A3G2L9B1_9FLAO|nr:hypothetical protein D1013_16390 [Euzebyella marina]
MLVEVLEKLFIVMYLLTFLASLYRYPRYFETRLKYLPIVFFYTLLNEILGYFTFHNPKYGFFSSDSISYYNMIIYNIYNIVFFIYFFYIYWYYVENKKNKIIIIYASILFILVSFINPFFQNFIITAQIGTYVVGGIVLLLCIITYFNQCYKEEIFFWKDNLLIWISLGLLIFYTGYLPIKVSRFIHSVYQTNEAYHVRIVHYSLISVMYLLFIVGFLRMKKRMVK